MWNLHHRILGLLLLLLQFSNLSAQSSYRDYMRSGNRLFRDSVFAKSEVDYRKVVELAPRFPQGYYNLGNALLWQQKPKDAMKEYEKVVKLETNKSRLATTYHNMGVILQSQKQYAPAIECYKNALRNRPSDEGSRYNLVLCQYLLKKNPQDNKDQNNSKENKDGSGQNKEEDKKSEKKDQQQQNKEKKEDKRQGQQNQQQNQNKMSKQNAEQLLNAAMQDEKATQDKVKKAMSQPQRRRLEKQW